MAAPNISIWNLSADTAAPSSGPRASAHLDLPMRGSPIWSLIAMIPHGLAEDCPMSVRFSRRDILATTLGVAGCATVAALVRPQPASAASLRLTAGTRTLEVNGKAASVFSLVGPGGKPGLTLAPGERFAVSLANDTKGPTLIHWHGQLPPWMQDGFPWPQTPPIPAGDTRSYDYVPIAGTFWMHSHQGLQEQSLMTAPLIVYSGENLRADRQEVVLMLHDFSFRSPNELFA